MGDPTGEVNLVRLTAAGEVVVTANYCTMSDITPGNRSSDNPAVCVNVRIGRLDADRRRPNIAMVVTTVLRTRAATPADAAAIAAIYNEGIADRIATFETAPRSSALIRKRRGATVRC